MLEILSDNPLLKYLLLVTLFAIVSASAYFVTLTVGTRQVARQRLSTVYMPGYKITMLPDDVVQAYTLQEGRDCPAVSLYASFDEASLAAQGWETGSSACPSGPTCTTTSSMPT